MPSHSLQLKISARFLRMFRLTVLKCCLSVVGERWKLLRNVVEILQLWCTYCILITLVTCICWTYFCIDKNRVCSVYYICIYIPTYRETCVHFHITSPQICNIAKVEENSIIFFQSSKNCKISSNPPNFHNCKFANIVNSLYHN